MALNSSLHPGDGGWSGLAGRRGGGRGNITVTHWGPVSTVLSVKPVCSSNTWAWEDVTGLINESGYQGFISPMKDHLNVWVAHTQAPFLSPSFQWCLCLFVCLCFFFCTIPDELSGVKIKLVSGKSEEKWNPSNMEDYSAVCKMCENQFPWIITELCLLEYLKLVLNS